MSTASVDNLPNGTILDGRYKITGVLGEGGFAVVYRAVQLNIKRQVAIKVLRLESRGNAAHVQRLIREAETAAQLRHPNVVTIYDAGTLDTGHPFVVMELFSGRNLKRVLRVEGALEPERAVKLFSGALSALAEAHKLGVIHRDLKPSNLILTYPNTDKETLKIIDFGTTRVLDSDSDLTGSGLLGTPGYLPPEYIQSHTVTPAMDVYQMGLVLVEMLIGRKVVHGTPYACLVAHASGDLDIPEELTGSALGEVVLAAVHHDPEQRYANAEVFKQALEEVDLSDIPPLPVEKPSYAGSGGGSTDLSIADYGDFRDYSQDISISRSSVVLPPELMPKKVEPPPPKSNAAVWGVVALLAIALCGLGVYVAVSNNGAPKAAETTPQPATNVPAPAADEGKSASEQSVILHTAPAGLEVINADDGVSMGHSPLLIKVTPGKPFYVQIRKGERTSELQRVEVASGDDKALLNMQAWLDSDKGDATPTSATNEDGATPKDEAEAADAQPSARKTPKPPKRVNPHAKKAAPKEAAPAAQEPKETTPAKPKLGNVDDIDGAKRRPKLGTIDDVDGNKPSVGTVD